MFDFNRLTRVFISAFLCSVIIYGFVLTHFTLSIDGEFFNNYTQTIALGRWGHAFLREFLLPEPFAPFFTTILTLIFLSLAAALSTELYKLTTLNACFMAILVFCVPQFAYQMDFANQSDTVALGMVFAVTSVLCFTKINIKNRKYFSPLSILLYVFAISIYQSLSLLPVTLIIGHCLFLRFNNYKNTKDTVLLLSSYTVVAIISVVIYFLISLTVQKTTGIMGASYITDKFRWSIDFDNALSDSISATLSYFTFKAFYGLSIYSLVAVPISGIVFYLLTKKDYNNLLASTMLMLLLALSPFIMLIVLGLNQSPRTLTSMGFAFSMLMTLAFEKFQFNKFKIIIISIFVLSACAISSQLFYSDYQSEKSTRFITEKIVSDIYKKYPDFDSKTTPVYFYGMHIQENPWKKPNSDIFGESFLSWDGGNNYRIIAYIYMSGIANLTLISSDKVDQAKSIAQTMSEWPYENSINRVNGVIIIKLGKYPGIY